MKFYCQFFSGVFDYTQMCTNAFSESPKSEFIFSIFHVSKKSWIFCNFNFHTFSTTKNDLSKSALFENTFFTRKNMMAIWVQFLPFLGFCHFYDFWGGFSGFSKTVILCLLFSCFPRIAHLQNVYFVHKKVTLF